jgi:hypothetical protein
MIASTTCHCRVLSYSGTPEGHMHLNMQAPDVSPQPPDLAMEYKAAFRLLDCALGRVRKGGAIVWAGRRKWLIGVTH